ncbi:hypothetical protein LINPERPRIM_LOCUS5705 [Linum perenne]
MVFSSEFLLNPSFSILASLLLIRRLYHKGCAQGSSWFSAPVSSSIRRSPFHHKFLGKIQRPASLLLIRRLDHKGCAKGSSWFNLRCKIHLSCCRKLGSSCLNSRSRIHLSCCRKVMPTSQLHSSAISFFNSSK